MNRIVSQIVAIAALGTATALGCIVSAQGVHVAGDTVNAQTDGAFRDGWFLGRLDARHGRKPHLASGRWSTQTDRRSFVYAYLQAYRERYDGAVSQPNSSQVAGEKGYRDGVADGLQQRYKAGVFRMDNDNYQKADHGYSVADGSLDQYQRTYREAYSNGYQEGYYGPVQSEEASDMETEIDWH